MSWSCRESTTLAMCDAVSLIQDSLSVGFHSGRVDRALQLGPERMFWMPFQKWFSMAVSSICGSISVWKEMGLSAISSELCLLWFVQVSIGCRQLRRSLRVAAAVTGPAAPRFQVQHPCDFLRPFLTASSVQLSRPGFWQKEGMKNMKKLGRAVSALHWILFIGQIHIKSQVQETWEWADFSFQLAIVSSWEKKPVSSENGM